MTRLQAWFFDLAERAAWIMVTVFTACAALVLNAEKVTMLIGRADPLQNAEISIQPDNVWMGLGISWAATIVIGLLRLWLICHKKNNSFV